jgi:hypothetical protein
MVYLLRADKPQRYENGRSRIIYIGETRKGTKRPAASAASKALKAFGKLRGKLRGVKRIDVHPVTFRGRRNVRMWEVLERDLLSMFKEIHGGIPFYNRQGGGKKFGVAKIRYFRPRRLKNLITALS